jgi:NADH-quinone oxidoreductase subunit E
MQHQAVFEGAVKAQGARPGALIAILQDIQEQLHYLPRECFPYLAAALGVGEAAIYSVATFYENFSLWSPGESTCWRVRTAPPATCAAQIPIMERLHGCARKLGPLRRKKDHGLTTCFTVETVLSPAWGACGLAPVLTVNDRVHPAMTPDMGVWI